MTCKRAQSLDLAAYLVDPGDPEWAEFRGHYPTCRDCSAALASWTKLERALGARSAEADSPHPEPAQLETFDALPNTLPVERWRAIDTHLKHCRRCADELAALRSFDLAGLSATAPPRGIDALRELGRAASDAVRTLAGRARETAADVSTSLGPEPAVALQSTGHRIGSREPVAVLVALGELAGEAFPLFDGERKIGRGPECALRLEHDSLPREAAQLEIADGRCVLVPLAARPPVLVNGAPIERAELRDGDRVTLGGVELDFRRVGNTPR